MIVTRTIEDCRNARAPLGRLAIVPTMGALHAGHLSLVEIARQKAPRVAVTIFVNPTQFGPGEDFQNYPRPIEKDLGLCERAGVDMVFNPSPAEMYPPGAAGIQIDIPSLASVLDGRFRPTHFAGVCQVVAKLFNIIQPQVAVFGKKDFQQLRVLAAMVQALNYPIEIVGGPTLRDPDGMAMSSRNAYLLPPQRKRALTISRALLAAQEQFRKGDAQADRLLATARNILLREPDPDRVPMSIDYVALVDAVTLREISHVTSPAVMAAAVRVGPTRLIDNVELTPASA